MRVCGGDERPPTIPEVYRLANDWEFLSSKIDQVQSSSEFLLHSDPISRCQFYFRNEFVSLPDDARNSVIGTLNNMLNPLCGRSLASIVDGRSTVSLRDAASGSKIIYLNLPQAKAPKAGRILGLLMKLSFFAEIRKKELRSGKYSFFFADEFQEFFTSDQDASDTRFFAVSREFDHCNIVATQNMNNFTMQGDKKDAVMSLLANIKTKIFLQNSDQQTNAYASELFGRHVEELGGGHISAQAQIVPNLAPGDFVKLRTPEKGKCDYCDSYMLIESGFRVDTANRANRWPIVYV
ncbi:MAG: type IV secretion system DNA-binding domain-containing protein [Pirellulaceae bacterium]